MSGVKGKSGGARKGAGRPAKDEQKRKKTYSVNITPERYDKIVAKYGSLSKALEAIRLNKNT